MDTFIVFCLFSHMGVTLKVNAVSVGLRQRCDPHAVADEGSRWRKALFLGFAIDGQRIATHEVEAHTLPAVI